MIDEEWMTNVPKTSEGYPKHILTYDTDGNYINHHRYMNQSYAIGTICELGYKEYWKILDRDDSNDFVVKLIVEKAQ